MIVKNGISYEQTNYKVFVGNVGGTYTYRNVYIASDGKFYVRLYNDFVDVTDKKDLFSSKDSFSDYCSSKRKKHIKIEKVTGCKENEKEKAASRDIDFKVPTMITIDEVSERTGLTKRFIRECVKEDKIVYIMVGRKILVNFEKFIDFLNGEK